MAKQTNTSEKRIVATISRPNVHSKTKSSSLKSSKLYKKKNVGQGK